MSTSSSLELASPRAVHIVDTTNGPLAGDGHYRRMFPFALTATICVAIAIPAASWTRPGIAVAGSILSVATIAGSLISPWHRFPRLAQLVPPFLFLVAILLLASASGQGIGSPFIIMTAMPVMWLALYESRASVVSACALAGAGLWLAAEGDSGSVIDRWSVTLAVFVVCAVGMAVTLNGLVGDARQLALSLRAHQVALEHAAGMLDALPERVNRYRLSDHTIMYCNTAWATQYNVERSEATGRRLEEFLSEDEMDGLHSQLAILGPDRPVLVDTVARSVHNAPEMWIEWADRYLPGEDGAEVLSVGRDVTGRRDAEVRLADSEARFRDLADKSADVVWRFADEPYPHFEYMSPSVESILGYPASYFLEDFGHMIDILDESGKAAIKRARNGEQVLSEFDFHFRHADGSIVIGETRTTVVVGGLQGVSRDVTELRRLQESLSALALHDPLTGLANRRLFTELLDADLARTQRNDMPLGVAFIDLDDFKEINDIHGHDVGDYVLCETARRMVATVRGTDTVARIGGDEFVIVYEPNDANAHNIIERMDRALAEPIVIAPGVVLRCPASIGTADTRTHGYNAEALLASADDAMYEVKRARRFARDAFARVVAS